MLRKRAQAITTRSKASPWKEPVEAEKGKKMKRRRNKRLFALLLSLMMILGTMTTSSTAYAQDIQEETAATVTAISNDTISTDSATSDSEAAAAAQEPVTGATQNDTDNAARNASSASTEVTASDDTAAKADVPAATEELTLGALPSAQTTSAAATESNDALDANDASVNDENISLQNEAAPVDEATTEDVAHSHEGWKSFQGYTPSTQKWDGTHNYYLSDDALCRIINVTGDTTLCLNGHVLAFQDSNTYRFNIKNGATLTIIDCSESKTGYITRTGTTNVQKAGNGGGTAGHVAVVEAGGTLVLKSGSFKKINSDCRTSNVAGVVKVDGGTFRMDGGSISDSVFKAKSLNAGGAVMLSKNGSLFMNGGTIKNCSGSKYGGAVSVWKGSFTMNGGTIMSCSADDNGGGVYLDSADCSFTMAGGAITSNTAGVNGGGIYSKKGSVTISSGTVSDNKVVSPTHGGGGIYTVNGKLTISGGTISGNTAQGGGGIQLTDTEATMTGGSITGNTSTEAGGGIYIAKGSMTITGGSISGNTSKAGVGGGAIYVHNNSTLYMERVLITGNGSDDKTETSGIWNCGAGSTTMYLTNGGALYGNDGYEITADQGGNDYSRWFISQYMLGGGLYQWEQDVTALSGRTTLENGPTEEAANTAKSLARVTITNNNADRGGSAISVNGDLVIGTYDLTDVHVTKTWEDENNSLNTRPETITVSLKYQEWNTETESWDIYDTPIATAELSETNQWSYTFNNMELPEGAAFTVEETDVPAGYVSSVTSSATAKDESRKATESFEITNTYVPTSVSVQKIWDDADDQDGIRPDAVTVYLYADDVKVQDITLREDGDWTSDITGLPRYSDTNGETEIVYTVEEEDVEGYTASVTGNAADGFVITNTHTPKPAEPEKPDVPKDPDIPQNPDTPKETNVPTDPGTPAKPSVPQKKTTVTPKAVKTGDDTASTAWLLLIGFAGVSAAGACAADRKRRSF